MPSEREKMLQGQLYQAWDPELSELRERAHQACHQYSSSAGCNDAKKAILQEQLPSNQGDWYIEPPFFCDYLVNLHLGKNVYLNADCTILDCAAVHLGDEVKIGPKVQIYTATHPIDPATRAAGPELAHPIKIGSRVWIGGGSIILPGVTIGDDTVIGAGSVVTKDIPPSVVAAGNPCRVIRSINDDNLNHSR